MKWIKREPKIKPRKTDSPIDKIAKIRGINDSYSFLNPSKEDLNSPYLLKNIEEACNRIILAISKGERITVSYDADADGITSATIMRRYLSNYTENVGFIYNERNHGHGINEQTRLDFVKDKDFDENGNIIDGYKRNRYERNKENMDIISNTDLLILIDSSSNDSNACKTISEMGVDIIILDHHAIERENKYALIVNPQQDGDKYPNKSISGAGVVFKVIEVMEDTLDSVDIWQYNDLVAVGI